MTDAVLLHPYFAYGGDQNNPVIKGLNDALLETDIVPHRFNFSGAEKPKSVAEAVAQIEACDGPVILMGYSYGGEIASEIVHPAVKAWVLIAPALITPQFVSPSSPLRDPVPPPIAADPRPKLVLLAEHDAWFGAEVIEPLIADWQACEKHILPHTDHFFAGHAADAVQRAVSWAKAL